jgi:hypothetical protein
MKSPTVELRGKKVILLTGARTDKKTGKTVDFEAPDKLQNAALQNPDAVAFGYTSGQWVAAA